MSSFCCCGVSVTTFSLLVVLNVSHPDQIALLHNRVDKNRDFFNKNQKIDFFDLNRIFLI